MNISLPIDLPAARVLRTERRHTRKPLRVGLVNLMPRKTDAELQFARLLGHTHRTIELILIHPDGYRPKTTKQSHLDAFYQPLTEVAEENFDGVIVTGAPLEHLRFEDVTYWPELTTLFDWLRDRQIPALHICWAALAAIYHYHGISKHRFADKLFGVFTQDVTARDHFLLDGIADAFPTPVSRYAEVRELDLPPEGAIHILAKSEEAGLGLLYDESVEATYQFNHLEYARDTLLDEYRRDLQAGKAIRSPKHYFHRGDPRVSPVDTWRATAIVLMSNWVKFIENRYPSSTQATGTYG